MIYLTYVHRSYRSPTYVCIRTYISYVQMYILVYQDQSYIVLVTNPGTRMKT